MDLELCLMHPSKRQSAGKALEPGSGTPAASDVTHPEGQDA